MKKNKRVYRIGLLLGLGVLIFLSIIFFYNESDLEYYPLEGEIFVAPHYHGADATIIQLTDHYYPNTYPNFQKDSRKNAAAYAEFLAFKHNIPLHVFEETDKWEAFENFLKTGRGGASVYYPSCFKEFEESRLNSIISDIESVYGRRPTTLAYGCGKTDYSENLPKYILGGRNSSAPFSAFNQEVNTWYGDNCGDKLDVDFSDTQEIINRPSGGRFYSEIQRYSVPIDSASKYVKAQVVKTVQIRGFYTNFMHWQDYYPNKNGDTIEGVDVMPYLFKALQDGTGSARVAKIDYNEAIEYLYAKEAIDSISLSKNTEDKFRLNITFRKNRPIDYSVIKTPVTFILPKKLISKFEKKAVHFNSEYGLEVIQDKDNFYVNIPLDFSKETNLIDFQFINSEENIPFAFQKPILNKTDKNTVISNSDSKFVIFRRKKSAPEYDIEIVDRKFDYSKEYRLSTLDSEYDYFCGAINKQRESSLIAL